MKFESYRCDMCQTVKGSGNHWFKWFGYPGLFTLAAWDTHTDEPDNHLCSDACVIKKVQSWLSEQQAGSTKEVA